MAVLWPPAAAVLRTLLLAKFKEGSSTWLQRLEEAAEAGRLGEGARSRGPENPPRFCPTLTTRPEGTCFSTTQLLVLLVAWPPGPCPFTNCSSRSLSSREKGAGWSFLPAAWTGGTLATRDSSDGFFPGWHAQGTGHILVSGPGKRKDPKAPMDSEDLGQTGDSPSGRGPAPTCASGPGATLTASSDSEDPSRREGVRECMKTHDLTVPCPLVNIFL